MKKSSKLKIIARIILACICIFAIYNLYLYFASNKIQLDIITASSYYSDSNIEGIISLKNTQTSNNIAGKVKVSLYDQNNKKVKGVKETYKISEDENINMEIPIPDNIETGMYTLKLSAYSGIKFDKEELSINIVNDQSSKIIISLDKGIYKPGDTINYRALVVSGTNSTPIENEINVSIYDGNDNRVYSESAKTSEYGIVSGSFELADEVNSGNYNLKVSTESNVEEKSFVVNPYITPQFDASIDTDKDTYLVGDTAEITISSKYFFGEAVKGATVTGTINTIEFSGITNEDGNFVTTYNVVESGKIAINAEIVDSSNYYVEANKTISAGTDIFEIKVLPEYGNIYKGIDNEVFIFTSDANGNQVKTYSTVTIGTIKKQVISDENGAGKFTLTSSEISQISSNDITNMKVVSEDMEGNQVSINPGLRLKDNSGILIKTDDVKYSVGDDIEITLVSSVSKGDNKIYICKDKEILKMISTESETVDVNLDDVYGLVDIYAYSSSENEYSHRTVFINPNKSLNISMTTDNETYSPGDTLNIEFNVSDENNENTDAALLVSILDESVLSLASNDLSIDNIKLALSDIKLSDDITAADLYAIMLNNSSNDSLLRVALLNQTSSSPNVISNSTSTTSNNENIEYLYKATVSVLIYVAIILMCFVKTSKRMKNFIIALINVVFIGIVLLVYLYDFLYYEIDLEGFLAIFINFVLAIVIYGLILYKEKDFIFNFIKEYILIPIMTLILIRILFTTFIKNDYIGMALIIILGIILIAITICKVNSRKRKLNKFEKMINYYCTLLIKSIIFWLSVMLVNEITKYAFLIILACYVFYKKFVKRETTAKMVNGKITINITGAELLGGFVAIAFVIVIFIGLDSIFSLRNISTTVSKNDEYTNVNTNTTKKAQLDLEGYDIMTFDSASSSTTISEDAYDKSTSSSKSNGLSITSIIDDVASSFSNKNTTSSVTNSVTNENLEESVLQSSSSDNTTLDSEEVQNVRNVFLESLAFIPELITENSEANFNTTISDNITTWNIQVVGNTKNGNIGYTSGNFKVFQEVFVDFSVPTNSVVGDKISIPVTVYNYSENDLILNLNVKENDWSNIGTYQTSVNVSAGNTQMVYVPIEITKEGTNILRVEASNGNVSDIVEKNISVSINGLEITEVSSSGTIQSDYTQDLIFNEEAIEGTKNIKIKLYASPISEIIEGMENILKMPTGCFEQTSSSLYPDVLVLKYLRNNDISNSTLEEKVNDYISKGYQKLLTYEVNGTKGGYSLYGNSPAETVITAFGLMEMKEISEVYEIDENVIENMKEFIFSKQKSNGSFDYKSIYIGNVGSTTDTAMNAYITWALSEVYPDDSRIEKSVNYLKNKINSEETDGYTIALMANIYANIGDKSNAKKMLNKLSESIVEVNDTAYISSTIKDYYGSYGKSQNIQATALASIAYSKVDSSNKNNKAFINYIISSKDKHGTWSTTQATVLALKSINEYNENSDLSNQTITVTLNGENSISKDINDDYLDVYEFNFDNVDVENHIEISMKKGKIRYEIIKDYYIDYSNVDENTDIKLSQTIDQTVNVNDVVNQNITLTNSNDEISNGLLEINIPQGMSVLEDSLLQLKYDKKIEKYEYNYGKIYLYIRNIEANDNLSFDIQYRALYPEEITGASIRFYDYYNPETEAISKPVQITVNE